MSANSKIEWTDHTFNPWIGCTRVSPGCDNCYAAVSTPARVKHITWGPNEWRHRTAPSTWKQPVAWNAAHAEFFAKHGRRQRVFCASLADVFDNEVGNTWRSELLGLIYGTPNLDWLLLTKRIGNVPRLMVECTEPGHQWTLPPNVWLGASIVNQEEADRDIPKLLLVPTAKRFLSMEPLLGPVDISPWLECTGMPDCARCDGKKLDWVIVGGESGPGARPMHPDWARNLRDQCAAAGVPFLFKQWGEWVDVDSGPSDDAAYEGKADCWVDTDGVAHNGALGVDFMHGTYPMYRVGKKAAGRLLNGREWSEVPL